MVLRSLALSFLNAARDEERRVQVVRGDEQMVRNPAGRRFPLSEARAEQREESARSLAVPTKAECEA